jgi:hypothetical protein
MKVKIFLLAILVNHEQCTRENPFDLLVWLLYQTIPQGLYLWCLSQSYFTPQGPCESGQVFVASGSGSVGECKLEIGASPIDSIRIK